MNKSPELLIDLDCTLVSMLQPWLRRYNALTGENVKVSDIKDYDVGLACKNQEVLYKILNERGFFYDMEPMPGAAEHLQKLLDHGYNITIVTQPPRRAEFAVRDKRRWMLKHFPDFSLVDMIFCHKKEMIKGDLLFDDKPGHLIHWKEANPEGVTAKLDWVFSNVETDFTGSLENGWVEFYEFVLKTFPL